MSQTESIISGIRKQFAYYQMLGEKTMEQLEEPQLFIKPSSESNSIAIIVQHLSGNMLSRWTDFRTTDGEKEWRHREQEFEPIKNNRASLMKAWHEGWDCLFKAIDSLGDHELNEIIYIRNQGHTILDALHRQLAHYPYHVGQMVFLGKILLNEEFKSLSIPKGKSTEYNHEKFSHEKSKTHFTDEYLKNNHGKDA
jgi:hypothetical protein